MFKNGFPKLDHLRSFGQFLQLVLEQWPVLATFFHDEVYGILNILLPLHDIIVSLAQPDYLRLINMLLQFFGHFWKDIVAVDERKAAKLGIVHVFNENWQFLVHGFDASHVSRINILPYDFVFRLLIAQ